MTHHKKRTTKNNVKSDNLSRKFKLLPKISSRIKAGSSWVDDLRKELDKERS